MNFTRNGKIARLPKPIRDELNTRIDHAESGPKLAAWLNALPEVKQILGDHFAGRPINNQNISEWRNGGYQDYLQVQEDWLLNQQLAEHAETMQAGPDAGKISETFAAVTAAEFVRASRILIKETTDAKKRWEVIRDIQRELIRHRREDYRASHLKIRQEKWTHQFETEKALATQAAFTEERRQMLAYFQLKPELKDMSQKMGGDAKAWDHAAFLLELQHNLKIGFLERKGPLPSYSSSESYASHHPPHVNPQETFVNPLQPENMKPSEPSPRGRGQGEGGLPLSEAANISSSPSAQTSGPTSSPIKPQTPSKTPEIKVHQTLAESLNNPPQNPDSNRPSCRPSGQPTISNPRNSQCEMPAYPESRIIDHSSTNPSHRTNVQGAKP